MNSPAPRRRVEIVHESLLSNWPRLIRWRAEDVGGAQLRDELRQAALVWNQHERKEDFLWQGTAFREYQLWREHYPGGLTTLEEEFARMMETLAARHHRRRQILSLTLLSIALLIALGFGVLWRTGAAEKRRAEVAAERATASKLLALGQAVIEKDRTAATAYAIESLRVADSPEAREFAVRALWQGPPATVGPEGPAWSWRMQFSPDGAWLAAGYWNGDLRVYPVDGSEPVRLPRQSGTSHIEISADGSSAFTTSGTSSTIHIWSTRDWSLLRAIDLGSGTVVKLVAASSAEDFVIGQGQGWDGPSQIRRWTGQSEPAVIDPSLIADTGTIDVRTGLIAIGVDHDLKVRELDGPPAWRTLGSHPDVFTNLGSLAVDSQRRFVVSGGAGGHIRLWSLDSSGEPIRRIDDTGGNTPVSTVLSPDGTLLCLALGQDARIWELAGMASSDPIILPSPTAEQISGCGVHPEMKWAATHRGTRLSLWNLATRRVRTLTGHDGGARSVVFSPDGRYLYSIGIGDGKVYRWPLQGEVGETEVVVFDGGKAWGWGLAIDPAGRFLIALKRDGVWQIPLNGDEPRQVAGAPPPPPPRDIIDPTGRHILLSRFADALTPDLTVLDLETGERREFGSAAQGDVTGWSYDARGRLVVVRGGRLEVLDPVTGEIDEVVPQGAIGLRMSPDRSKALTAVDGRAMVIDLETGEIRSSEWNLSTFRAANGVMWSALGPDGAAVEVREDRAILAGYLDQNEPHLLYGHDRDVADVAISPDGKWVAAATREGVNLWPMPARNERPLHTLPYDELLAKLESLTNVRAVADTGSPYGYRIDIDDAAYRGWKEVPEW